MSTAFAFKRVKMSFYYVAVVIGYSIGIPAIIGLIRFSKITTEYRPFIYYCVLDVLNHTLSTILIRIYHNNIINSNIFVFIEALLFLWLFKTWRKSGVVMIYWLGIFLGILWIVDNIILHELNTVNSLYRIGYSFVLVFLSIEQMNILITSVRTNLLKNACFMICAGIVIYYTYKATIEVFFFIRLEGSQRFYANIFKILVFVNLFVNLIFAWAMLWIPTRPKFISPR